MPDAATVPREEKRVMEPVWVFAFEGSPETSSFTFLPGWAMVKFLLRMNCVSSFESEMRKKAEIGVEVLM